MKTKPTLGAAVYWDGTLAKIIGFNVHGYVVLGYTNLLGQYQTAWASREDITVL